MQENTTMTSYSLIHLWPKRDSVNPFSDELAKIFQWITFSVMNQVVAIFGVGSNIINIICFVKQGFKDSVNVSLLGLAVADMCSLITVPWTNLCLCPAFNAADLPFHPFEFQYLVTGMPHVAFTRISSWITALITMERCLCIVVPLKVKVIITPKRVTIIVVLVFVILMGSMAPLYIANTLGLKFFPDRNKTIIGMVATSKDSEIMNKVSHIINNVCFPFGAFAVTIICTAVLVVHLHKKTKWRKTSSSTASALTDNVSIRNQKVSKMVVSISALFIICFIPMCIFFIGMSVEPEVSVVGKYRNAIAIFAGFCIFLESLNSAVNIFIYYEMSSKYREILCQMFGIPVKS